jgi:hypothetical protein
LKAGSEASTFVHLNKNLLLIVIRLTSEVLGPQRGDPDPQREKMLLQAIKSKSNPIFLPRQQCALVRCLLLSSRLRFATCLSAVDSKSENGKCFHLELPREVRPEERRKNLIRFIDVLPIMKLQQGGPIFRRKRLLNRFIIARNIVLLVAVRFTLCCNLLHCYSMQGVAEAGFQARAL